MSVVFSVRAPINPQRVDVRHIMKHTGIVEASVNLRKAFPANSRPVIGAANATIA